MLGHRPTNAPRDTGGSMSRIKSGEFGRILVVFHRFDPYLARVSFAGPYSRHESLRIGSRDP